MVLYNWLESLHFLLLSNVCLKTSCKYAVGQLPTICEVLAAILSATLIPSNAEEVIPPA